MRQRAIIAMALVNDPWLLVVDEPTTGLDPRIQNDILQMLEDLQQRMELAILFISHDLPVVSRAADSLAVMQEGKMVEQGPVESLLRNPQAPYTRRLLTAAQPRRIRPPRPVDDGTPLLRLEKVCKTYRRAVAADEVDLVVREGEVVGLVGESGAGKSTLARMILGLERPDAGRISFDGRELNGLTGRELRMVRRQLHLVFQDPYQALPEHLRVREIVAEPLRIHGEKNIERRACEALEEVEIIEPHPIFEGVLEEDLTFRRGVAGFFARGHHPPPPNTEVLVTLAGGEPVTYLDRSSTKGTILLHSGNDLWGYAGSESTAGRMVPQLLRWIREEGARE